MKLRQVSTFCTRGILAVALTATLLLAAINGAAQVPAPPPPGVAPAPPPPAATAAAPAAAASGIDPIKEREIIDHIVNGKSAVKTLDLASAQMYFEQAFAKCDEYQVAGPLLARVYMALGSLFAGYLQQVPQGTDFMKMALSSDPTVKPEADLLNDTIQTTFDMVRERMGITGPAQVGQGGGVSVGPGGFWVMKHQRVTQAKRMFPFGIYVVSNPMVAMQGVRFYFRLPSDRNYQMAEMQKNGDMYGILIGCDAIALLDPSAIYYYIQVIGGDGSIIANEGTVDNPIEIKMIDQAAFMGQQPNLPGMPPHEVCNPDDAAPCPPWDPHCHDIPCVTDEDCIGYKVCEEGYCMEGEGGDEDGDGELGAIGISIWAGMGMGFGVVGGRDENGLCGNDSCLAVDGNGIPLATGVSPSWMFVRFGAGYFILDWLRAGLWMRMQNISSDKMRIAGMGASIPDQSKVYGPMWGLTGSVFYWGNGELFSQGQVVDEHGMLAEDQGLRLYARLEFNFYGATYHSMSLTGKGEDEDDGDKQVNRQRASGMQALGLGPGILYGIHKNIDVGFEIMYDWVGLGTDTWAHTFDMWLQLHLHF